MNTPFPRYRWFFLIPATLLPVGRCPAQPYVTFYEAPGYDSTTGIGYTGPIFGRGESTGRLLTEAGTATWDANPHPGQVRLPLRWNPLTEPAVALDVDANPGAGSYAINDDETIVGSANTDSGFRAALWSAGGSGLHILQVNSNFISRAAHDINDSGVVVGFGEQIVVPNIGYHAVLWDTALIPHILDTPATMLFPESTFVQALAVNEASVVVGNGRLFAGGAGTRAVRWDSAGSPIVLGDLGSSPAGDTNAAAWAINSAGDAVGTADKYDAMGNSDGTRAVRWSAATTAAVELEVLGADSNGVSESKVFDINDAGFSVGRSLEYVGNDSQSYYAVQWNAAGQVTELGHLPGGFKTGEAHDINEAGIAVGQAARPAGFGSSENVAVYWDVNGNAIDLNTLIAPRADWVLNTAWAISDSGWILGEGSHTDEGSTYSRVFMLQIPIPGDFDFDADIDGRDFLLWQRGGSPNGTPGGPVSASDLADWQANYVTVPLVATSVAVPEPGTWEILVAAVVAITASQRQNRYRRKVAKIQSLGEVSL